MNKRLIICFLAGILSVYSLWAQENETSEEEIVETTKSYEPFKGFHLGYTLQTELVQPATVFERQIDNNQWDPTALPGIGYAVGLEASYHFAKYCGFSVGLEYGTSTAVQFKIPHDRIHIRMYNLSIPVKFELHLPIKKDFWITSNIGANITPIGGITSTGAGYYDFKRNLKYSFMLHDFRLSWADLQMGLGFYYQIPRAGLFRAQVGLNVPMGQGGFGNYNLNYTDNNVIAADCGAIYSHNGYLSFQLAYIHTFHRKIKKTMPDPAWTSSLPRHEFQLNIGDPYMAASTRSRTNFDITDYLFPNLQENPSGPNDAYTWLSPSYECRTNVTPLFSFSYHFRLRKWLWIGATQTFSDVYQNIISPEGDIETRLNEYAISTILDVRFSYLNRKHVTLYSGLGLGLMLKGYDSRYDGNYFSGGVTITSVYQLTAFGVKAGSGHWFGNLELGCGYKGFISGGVSYDF